MNETFMKERPVFRLVLSMSLPMVLSMAVNALYNIVDSFFVARIGETAMTALSLVYPLQNLINAAAIGFGVGINAVIAYYLGAGEKEKADRAASLGFFYNALHGLVLMIVCLAVVPSFIRFFTSDDSTLDYALRYSRIVFLFSPVIACSLSLEKIFQAVGNMVVTMAALLVGCLSNIILDPILIFGLGPIPAMGIEGAALATGIGQVLSLLVHLVAYIRKPLPVRISFRNFSFDRKITGRLYTIGVPAVLNQGLPSLLVSSLNAILAGFSQSYVLVLGVYYKLQTFLYLSSNGIVQGIRPLVGYNYGAGEMKRVEKIFRTALSLSAGIMLAGTVLCQLIPQTLIGLFTAETDTIRMGALALHTISAGFVISAVSVTACGALEGLGKGAASLVISLLRYLILIVPAAFILSRFFGAEGVWHAFWITEWITAGAAYLIYRQKVRTAHYARTESSASV